MIAYRQTPPNLSLPVDLTTQSESPAILRLRMLEMTFAVERPLPEATRRSAYDLIGALKRSIAEKPSLTFADVVAKLKTLDEMADDSIGAPMDELQKAMIKSAIADLRRLPHAA